MTSLNFHLVGQIAFFTVLSSISDEESQIISYYLGQKLFFVQKLKYDMISGLGFLIAEGRQAFNPCFPKLAHTCILFLWTPGYLPTAPRLTDVFLPTVDFVENANGRLPPLPPPPPHFKFHFVFPGLLRRVH